MKKPDTKCFSSPFKNPPVIGGRNLRCFQGFGHALTVCPKTIPFGHDWAVVPEVQAPKNGRFIAAEAVPGVTPGRKVTHGP